LLQTILLAFRRSPHFVVDAVMVDYKTE